MDPLAVSAVGFVINLLMGGVMWFTKQAYFDVKKSNERLQFQIDHIKDNYMKADAFKEFKDELWSRLDRMESHWQDKLNSLKT